MQGNDESGELTYRQTDVLGLLALGLTAQESAAVLGISASTVEHDRGKLRERLDAKTPPHVVAIAYEAKLLPLKTERRARLEELIGRRS